MDETVTRMCERVRAAGEAATPLRIRGGGSKDFYGQALQGEVLDTSPLAGIVSYEPSELVVTVRAGTPLAQLEAELAQKGQCLPFEPPHFGGKPTVGGAVAAGLSGPARASVGALRDYVLGMVMVNGRGEALVFGGQVMKNVAGYDVSRLVTGSLGTLGLICEVSLKVLPVAPAQATLKFEMSQADALRRLNEWGGKPLPLNASCWVEDQGVGTLYLRLRGAVAAVESACQTLGGERQDNAKVAPDWQACRDQSLPWFTDKPALDLWRVSVPQSAPVIDFGDVPLIEWHGGQRWVRAARNDATRIREAAGRTGGHATLFRRGEDSASAARDSANAEGNDIAVFAPLKPPLDRIHRELKREFDPQGIFNRGRMYADF